MSNRIVYRAEYNMHRPPPDGSQINYGIGMGKSEYFFMDWRTAMERIKAQMDDQSRHSYLNITVRLRLEGINPAATDANLLNRDSWGSNVPPAVLLFHATKKPGEDFVVHKGAELLAAVAKESEA